MNETRAALSSDERHAGVARVERLLALCQRATNVLLQRLERHPQSPAIEEAAARGREIVAAGTTLASTLFEEVAAADKAVAKAKHLPSAMKPGTGGAESQAGTTARSGLSTMHTPKTSTGGTARSGSTPPSTLRNASESERVIGQLMRMANRMHKHVQSEVQKMVDAAAQDPEASGRGEPRAVGQPCYPRQESTRLFRIGLTSCRLPMTRPHARSS